MANVIEVKVPDIGDYKQVPVIEVLVKAGDRIAVEDSLLTLESDKATMEVPSPATGLVKEIKVKVGDKVSQGSLVLLLEGSDADAAPAKQDAAPAALAPAAAQPQPAGARQQTAAPPAPQSSAPKAAAEPLPPPEARGTDAGAGAHASPSVRRIAREFGVDLSRVKGSGPKDRVIKEDVQAYVKAQLGRPREGSAGAGFNLPPLPAVDFAKFGTVQTKPLTRIQKISGGHLHRNWISIPHVTQHDEADITELETFRKGQAEEASKNGIKITMMGFLMKAVVVALKQFPDFNASLSPDGESLVLKQYYHVGIAVDTPNGLVVPVIRDVDKKGLLDIAKELGEVSARMRAGKIAPADLQGGCFSISSLGGIGGSLFTPIINAPEVAILGVGKAAMKPVWNGKEFIPRLMLPLSLSYDHRVIDGAHGARFISFLGTVLADIRRLVL
jgi:pyruvate dehydrogenase E2 component (dihydrolipoamide acetyltransferase)